MKNYHEIQKTADEALNSLNGLQQLEANEFLHAKIMHRLQNKNKAIPAGYNRVMLRLAAVLILLLSVNCASFYVLKQRNTVSTAKPAGASAFADAYNLNTNQDSY